MKNICFLLFSWFIYSSLYAQTDLIPYRKGNLWGFSDINKKIIIPCQYDDAEPFKNGVATIQKNRLYGCIDKTGKDILPIKYDSIIIFNSELIIIKKEGNRGIFNVLLNKEVLPCQYDEVSIDTKQNIKVQKNGLWGIFDKNGKEIAPCKYIQEPNFDKGLAVGELSGRYELINPKGEILVHATEEAIKIFNEELYWIKKNDKWELYKINGKRIKKAQYDDISEYNDSNDFFVVRIGNQTGVLDKKGKEVVACKYDKIELTQNYIVAEKNKLKGVLDKKGKEMIPFKYDFIKELNQNLFKIEINSQYGIIDKAGTEIIPCIHKTILIRDFKDGKAFICSDEGCSIINEKGEKIKDLSCKNIQKPEDGFAMMWSEFRKKGVVSQLGQEILPCKYETVIMGSDKAFAVKLENKWTIFDNTGKEIIANKYQNISKYDKENDLFEIHFKDKLSFKNKEGKMIVLYKYDALEGFYIDKGLAIVGLGDKKGVIDYIGNEIIAPKYNKVRFWYKKKIIMAEYNNQWGVFDTNGTEIIPFKYESLDAVGDLEWFKAKYQDKWGVIDKNNNQLIECKYENFFVDNRSLKGAEVSIQDKWGFVNEAGKEVVPCMYEGTRYAKSMFGVKLNKKWGFVNQDNKQIIPFKYEFVGHFQEDFINVRYKNKWGFINQEGKEVIPCIYDEVVKEFENGKSVVMKNDEYFYIDTKGIVLEKLKNFERTEELIMVGIPDKNESRISGKLGYVDSKGTEYWEN